MRTISFLNTTALILTIVTIVCLSIPTAFALSITDGQAAEYVLGQPDFTTSSSGLSATKQYAAADVLVDELNSRTYVVDRDNHRVLVYETSSISNGEAAIAVLGAPDLTTPGNGTSDVLLRRPVGLALDVTGNRLFVSDDGNHRVVVFDVATVTTGEAAIHVLGQNDFTSSSTNKGGVEGVEGSLARPQGLAYDNANSLLYVADTSNSRVVVFDVTSITNGENAIAVLGQADLVGTDSTTASISRLDSPRDVSLDNANDLLYVSDSGNHRIMVFDIATIVDGEDAVALLGQGIFTGESANKGWVTSSSSLSTPEAINFDDVNNYLFVSDLQNNRVLVFDVSAIVNGEAAINVLGQPDFTSSSSNWGGALISDGRGGFYNGPGETGLSLPSGLYFDSTNELLYVTDSGNNRTLIFDLSAGAPAEEPSSRGYTHPPLCTATTTPSTITKGEQATLSWDIQWPTNRRSTFYMKVPKEGLFTSNVQSITISPEHTTTYRLATFNLFGANFCESTITVQDEQGTELTTPTPLLSASASSSPFVKALLSFLSSLFGR